MSEKYRIGDYEFNTYEEYLAAQEDVKKIDFITKEVDITNADVAVRLYTLIRNKEIVFHSKVGTSFSWYLTDLLVQNSQRLIEEQKKREEQAQKERRLRMAGMACIAAAVLCLGYYTATLWAEHKTNKEYERLQSMQQMTGHSIKDTFVDDAQPEVVEKQKELQEAEEAAKKADAAKKERIDPSTLTVLDDYIGLYKKNKDMVGWLKIDGMDINYPVLQTGEDNPDYYLHYNFEKEEDVAGSLFLDARNDFVNRDTNLIIYGHNMKNGTMFGSLKKYTDKKFFEKHRKIEFDTIYEKVHYSIVAVCLSKVNYEDDYTFRYYNFINAGSEEDFNAYLANIQQLTAFDQTIDISYGDELLTLSTCNNYTEDGRLFLVAKRE